MGRGNDAEALLVHELHQHLQDAPLIGLAERHFGLVEKQHRSVGKLGETVFEHGEHHLAVTRHLKELFHVRLVLEQMELVAGIVLLSVEEINFFGVDGNTFRPVDVAVYLLTLHCVMKGVQEGRLS